MYACDVYGIDGDGVMCIVYVYQLVVALLLTMNIILCVAGDFCRYWKYCVFVVSNFTYIHKRYVYTE